MDPTKCYPRRGLAVDLQQHFIAPAAARQDSVTSSLLSVRLNPMPKNDEGFELRACRRAGFLDVAYYLKVGKNHRLPFCNSSTTMGTTFSQIWPPAATLTEKNLPTQQGKVFIVTGGASGIGYELATILFHAGGKVYIAGRSEEKARQCIEKIKSSKSDSSTSGQLEYLHLELDDLTTIKSSAEDFKSKESKLHVLFNNAGVSLPPIGSKSKQGHELMIATNCLGPYLFTQLLLPTLKATAGASPHGTVRVVWTSSLVVDLTASKGGMDLADLESPPRDQSKNYATSKTGNWYLASELAHEVGPRGILSVTQNPGNLKTSILRHTSRLYQLAVSPLFSTNTRLGAYTELYAGLSPEMTSAVNGGYVIPWGRVHPAPREDLIQALKSKEEDGSGQASEFRKWCEKQTAEYK